jgi:hypothetical protein
MEGQDFSKEVQNVPEQEGKLTPEPEIVPEPFESVPKPSPEAVSTVLIACACGNSCTFKQDSLVLVRHIVGPKAEEKFDVFLPLYTCVNCHRQWFKVGSKVCLFEPGKVVRKLSPEGSR